MPTAKRLTSPSPVPDSPFVMDGVTVASCSYCGERICVLDILVSVPAGPDSSRYAVWHLRCARERSLFDLAFPPS